MFKIKFKIYLLFIVFIPFLLLDSINVFSQRFGNEWIIKDQNYLKVSILENGIYRINKTDFLKLVGI